MHDEHRDISEAGPAGVLTRDDSHKDVSETGNLARQGVQAVALNFKIDGRKVRIELRDPAPTIFVNDRQIPSDQIETTRI